MDFDVSVSGNAKLGQETPAGVFSSESCKVLRTSVSGCFCRSFDQL